MKFNKQIAIILILLSMLLSAIAVSIYFYNKNQQVLESSNQLVTIFVAKDNIKRKLEVKEKSSVFDNAMTLYLLSYGC